MSPKSWSDRRLWAGFVALVLVLNLPQFVPLLGSGSRAFGQASPGDSTIQFLNPSAGTSLELSTKEDGTGPTFHLVAWVDRLPESPAVEFRYKPGQSGAQEISIGMGTLVGADTYEFDWDLATAGPEGPDDVAAGTITRGTSGTLTAVLTSGGLGISRDQETIRINQESPPPCPPPGAQNNRACEDEAQGNTVELTYPVNGGSVGYYEPNAGQGPVNSILDVASSEGTGNVQAFYTLSRPGSEPQWKPCKNGTGDANESKAASSNGVRCEYAASDDPSRVSAVAARATDTHTSTLGTEANNIDAGDAHRSLPYAQDAQVLQLSPPTQDVDAGKCSPVITAQVLDQADPRRKIADVNVDVHAAGPLDRLSFDDSSGIYSSPNKPPERHPTEQAIDCETATNPPFSERQGNHELPDGNDQKHIESQSDTDDAGEWKFALHSGDAGGTQFVVWADEDGNDRLCSAEPQAAGAIGWSSAAPTPAGSPPEDTVCSDPTPTPWPTTPTPTTSPSVTPSPFPDEPRTVTLAADDENPTAGGRIGLAGQLFSPHDVSCADNESIQITRRWHGKRSEELLTTVLTDPHGRFELTTRVSDNADLWAFAPAHDDCGEALSSRLSIEVRGRVSIRAADTTPARYSFVKIRLSVQPDHPRTRVVLQRRVFGTWLRVAARELDRRSVGVFDLYTGYKRQTLRARWGGDRDHGANVSRVLVIETRD